MKKIQSNEGTRVLTRLYIYFRHSRAAYSTVSGEIGLIFERIQTVMVILVNCKYEKDPIKNEGAGALTTFLQFYFMGFVFRHSRSAKSVVRSRSGPNFELIEDFMAVRLICENVEDPIKNEGARVLTIL